MPEKCENTMDIEGVKNLPADQRQEADVHYKVTHRYHVGGSTDPLLVHPTHPDLLRPLTVTEHARIKQVPEKLVEGLSKTDGHILLGQGIAYAPVKALFHRIGQCLRAWQDSVSEQASQPVGYSLSRATG